MPVLTEIPINIDPEEIIASRGKAPIRPGLLRPAQEALELARSLWQPRAIYDWFDVRSVDGEEVHLVFAGEEGQAAVLHAGPKADLLAPAKSALVSVVTIGTALEEEVHSLQASGEHLTAYLLDSAGVVALGAVGETLRCLAEETATDREWGVSPSLSPGSLVGWSLRGQRDLCALLPIESIGVYLNKHNVLEPHKSASGLVGMGPGYESKQVGSVCKYCALQKTCWRRREDPA